MSGHSKWANIKHQKMKEDARRGQVFTKVARQIAVAVRQGGPDPEGNFRLRLAIDKARQVNMPAENIQRVIRRASGETDADNYEELVYEGYGPGGVAVLLQAMTNNRNRTASELRTIFSRYGGSLGESGCVAWMFTPRGKVRIAPPEGSGVGEDEVLLTVAEAGGEDVRPDEEQEGAYTVITAPHEMEKVAEALAGEGYRLLESSLTMVPSTTVTVAGKEAAQLLRLLEALEEQDDVQEVYANFDMAEEEVEQALKA